MEMLDSQRNNFREEVARYTEVQFPLSYTTPCLELFMSSEIEQFRSNRNNEQLHITTVYAQYQNAEFRVCVRSCTQHKQERCDCQAG